MDTGPDKLHLLAFITRNCTLRGKAQPQNLQIQGVIDRKLEDNCPALNECATSETPTPTVVVTGELEDDSPTNLVLTAVNSKENLTSNDSCRPRKRLRKSEGCYHTTPTPLSRSSSITQPNRTRTMPSLPPPLPSSTPGSQRTPRRHIDSSTSVRVQMVCSSGKDSKRIHTKMQDSKMRDFGVPPELQRSKLSKTICRACGLKGHK